VIVQWCLKGLRLNSPAAADQILASGSGLLSNWARSRHRIYWNEVTAKLTPVAIDRHVNHFNDLDPDSGQPYNAVTPFISLTAGTVERLPGLATNRPRRALDTALWFGSGFGTSDTAYVFVCWVIVGPRPAPGVASMAEEVRDLNQYRSYSAFQTEGEVLAKISVPDNQIRGYERWQRQGTPGVWIRTGSQRNRRFVEPEVLTNVRELIS
jgi:hypothetical protein